MPKPWEVLLLVAAFCSFLYANVLYFGWNHAVDREGAIYVGHWVTSILAALIYFRTLQENAKRPKE
jgi:hypothetical protein